MKKVISLSIFLSLVFISCSKKQTWYCECGQTNTSVVSYTTTITNATKNNASDLCYKAAGANSGMPANSYACKVSAQ